MKRRMKTVRAITICLIVCLLAGCGKKGNKDIEATFTPAATESPTPTEEATPTPTPEPTFTPTPTPRPAFGVTTMSLYKNIKDEKLRRRYDETYSAAWVKGRDITSFECIASDAAELKNKDYFQDLWREEWEKFENHDQCKIAYRVQFKTSDGKNIDKMLMKAGDELEYRDYIENYLYDDIHQVRGKWYSHLNPEDMNEETILSSLKFTAGRNIEKVYSPITVSAYIYYSDLDFDEEGNYVGAVSYTVQMVNTAADAKQVPDDWEENSTDVEPDDGEDTQEENLAPATAVKISVKNSNGTGSNNILDKSYQTTVSYKANDTITITSETEMGGIYLIWGSPVVSYTVTAGDMVKPCGEYGILHDYVAFDKPVKECVVKVSGSVNLCDVYAYTKGILPDTVQVWEPPYKEADVVIFSTHADDEVLFMGGVATLYGGVQKKRVQVVYLCHYWNGDRRREHEKLDGLWTMGLRAYPVNMPFNDYYATSLKGALEKYNYEDVLTSTTENIRRFKPLIVVTHDKNGEYGHGGHMLLYNAVTDAISRAADPDFRPDSAAEYGTWDVPKTYIHLWSENKIKLSLREPEEAFGGKSVLDVQKEAYKKHVSQQWTSFKVSDDYEYSCAAFGLQRTTVGADTGTNDMFENLMSYGEKEEKERLEREERERLEREEQERLEREEQERLEREEQERLEREQAEITKTVELTKAAERLTEREEKANKGGKLWKILLTIVIVLILLYLGLKLLIAYRAKQEEERRARARAERRRKAHRENAVNESEDSDEYDYL